MTQVAPLDARWQLYRLLSDPFCFPLYEEASALNVPICIHVSIANPQMFDFFSQAPDGGPFLKFKLGIVGAVKFEDRVRELLADHVDLAVIVEPLLIARRVLREQLGVLHRQLLEIVRHDE